MSPRVLIADDEELERKALRRIIGGLGIEGLVLLEAANGREALELAAESPPDVAVLDIRMPGIDGIEAARALREARPGLPVIFLTAHDRFEYALDALRLGADDYLLKPASAAEVAAALRRALGKAAGRASAEGEASVQAAGREAFPSLDLSEAARRIEAAAALLREEVRAGLAEGRVDEALLRRFASLSGAPWEAEPEFAAFRPASASPAPALRGACALLESLFDLAGSPSAATCLEGDGTEALALHLRGGPGKPGLEAIVEDFRVKARDELGLGLLAGVARAGPGGRPSPTELLRAARRAAALAGPARPVVHMSLSAADGPGVPGGGAPAPGEPAAEQGSGKRAVERALAFVEERLADNLSLDEVARAVGLSPSHLSRLLGRHTGCGFADCIARLRVERAKACLSGGAASVKEVAALVGFRDPAYFARVFRKFVGLSPAEYRDSPAHARERGARP